MSDFETVAASELHTATPGPAGAPNAPGQPSDIGVPAKPNGSPGKPRSLAGDAWRDLRRNPLFWIAAVVALLAILMAVVPRLFTPADPAACNLNLQHHGAQGAAIFGYDFQGCDVYARAVYGARASLIVGGFAALTAGIIAVIVGMIAGFFGGWTDAVLSRVVDIVLGIPLLLAAIVVMGRVPSGHEKTRMAAVVLVLGLLGWTTAARVIRSSVITAKQQDYVQAARMLGAGNGRIMWRHILPNSIAPVIVIITIALGSFIATEATLSFLGIGLQAPTISWGISIDTGRQHMREAVTPLAVPSVFLALTVLAFIMLGDAIRDAFDPKLR
ncbi:ABC transporter permease [Luedemannella helvata]|uniref:ABC transporter permease n=1 Tax=Luedemannella helvata TaxID=349315 RepID=A0ABP4VR46_9ACTN